MSRQRDKIRRTAAKWQVRIDRLEWDPIGGSAEKCGPSGGWFVELSDGMFMLAYHHEAICEMIANYAQHGSAICDEDIDRLKENGFDIAKNANNGQS